MSIQRPGELSDDPSLEEIERADVWQLDNFVQRRTRDMQASRLKKKIDAVDRLVGVVLLVPPTIGASVFAWTAPHGEVALAILVTGIVSVVSLFVWACMLDEDTGKSDVFGVALLLALLLAIFGCIAVFGGGTLIRWIGVSVFGSLS